MARGDRSAVALLMATTAFLGAATYFASPARADIDRGDVAIYEDAICETIASEPSVGTVLGIALFLGEEGYTGYDSGQILGYAVMGSCPQYMPLLMRFAEVFGDDEAGVA